MGSIARDLLRDGVLAPLLTLAAGFVVAHFLLLPFSLVGFLSTLLAALVWLVGLGGIRDQPADEPRGPPAWREALAAPDQWSAFFTPTRRALVYAAGLFVFGWLVAALAPRLA